MSKTIIHCTSLAGHHLEYLHHLYMGAVERSDWTFRFLMPSSFNEKKNLLSWPNAANITIEILEDIDENIDNDSLLKKSYAKARNLRKYVKLYNPTHIILIDLISYLPFLPFLVSSKVKVRGILYRIYLYEWKASGLLKKVQDTIKFILFSRCGLFERVFILNDSAAAAYLNRLYSTSHFCYLPDPVAAPKDYTPSNIRDGLLISEGNTVYLHPGGMLPYKGTLEMLKAFNTMEPSILSNITLILAGRVTPPIKEQFMTLFNQLKEKMQVLLMEGYLPDNDLADLFYSCDYVLIPYRVKSQSSGIVGHAAFYNKPVVVAHGGIIGKAVRRWHLGIPLNSPSAECIRWFVEAPISMQVHGESYVKTHSIEIFCEKIMN